MSGTGAGLDIVILGLSITSSWGNGHATTYRGLARALTERGHRVTFLERDAPWYAANRDLPRPPYARVHLYTGLDELRDVHAAAVREADLVMVGSYVPDGRAVVRWAAATVPASGRFCFYDIDTPATLAALERDGCAYLDRAAIPKFDLYLSFTGGPTLRRLERVYGARRARALHCSFDPEAYFPDPPRPPRWVLGYMGTFSTDRQPTLDRLLLEPARRQPGRPFVVAGPQYPEEIVWPGNVQRLQHIAPAAHRRFYCDQRFTLNVTRAAMAAAGYSPSVRLFEAAACGVPIISDRWPGLDTFFIPEREILLASSTEDVLRALHELPAGEALRIGARARRRVLGEHTAAHRAEQLEHYMSDLRTRPPAPVLQGLGARAVGEAA